MENILHERVIGQNEAIHAVSRAIRRSRVGIKSEKRPTGSFIFLGPTGVGKTELARALAEHLFDDESAMIRLDMSEYMEKHTVSKLIGAPPGYIGYEEGGQLTEKVRRHPYSVVLFDEIEKAHIDIFNILLQVLEEGELTDALGNVVDFRNTVIILTSNLGARDFMKNGRLGFTSDEVKDSKNERVMDELKRYFNPEFLNRVDDIIWFNPLTEKEIRVILDIMIEDLEDRLSDLNLEIKISQAAREELIVKGFDPKLGARPMRRTIEREIEDELAMLILSGKIKAPGLIQVGIKKGNFSFSFHAAKSEREAVLPLKNIDNEKSKDDHEIISVHPEDVNLSDAEPEKVSHKE